jgi:hypothetical protein
MCKSSTRNADSQRNALSDRTIETSLLVVKDKISEANEEIERHSKPPIKIINKKLFTTPLKKSDGNVNCYS